MPESAPLLLCFARLGRKVDEGLPRKENLNSHGARPAHYLRDDNQALRNGCAELGCILDMPESAPRDPTGYAPLDYPSGGDPTLP